MGQYEQHKLEKAECRGNGWVVGEKEVQPFESPIYLRASFAFAESTIAEYHLKKNEQFLIETSIATLGEKNCSGYHKETKK